METNPNNWQVHSKEVVHQNPWYSVRHDKVTHPDGRPGNYFVIDRNHCVFVVPVQDGYIHMVQQYRYMIDAECIEVPAGTINNGEEPLAAAKRELHEETGLQGDTWIEAGVFAINNGLSNELAYVFLVTDLSESSEKQVCDDSEFLTTHRYKIEDVYKMITDGKLLDGSSVTALAFVSEKIKAYV